MGVNTHELPKRLEAAARLSYGAVTARKHEWENGLGTGFPNSKNFAQKKVRGHDARVIETLYLMSWKPPQYGASRPLALCPYVFRLTGCSFRFL